jgi:alkylated DNA repair dioxygenase AlkB
MTTQGSSTPIEGLSYHPNCLPDDYCKTLYEDLTKSIPWRKMTWGRGRELPRMIFHYDNNHSEINKLIKLIEDTFVCEVSGVFMNYYRDGKDYTPEHRDEYDGDDVYTLSLGASRKFYFISTQENTKGEKLNYTLNNGDLIYFGANINRNYKHSLPKQVSVKEGRISIVFFGKSLKNL